MQVFDIYIDVTSFYLGAISIGVLATGFLVCVGIYDALVRYLSERRDRVESYGRHSKKGRQQARQEAVAWNDDPAPTVVMQSLKPNLEEIARRKR